MEMHLLVLMYALCHKLDFFEMNIQFERSACVTDEWYTPKEIIDALGVLDADPCAPVKPLWQTAIRM